MPISQEKQGYWGVVLISVINWKPKVTLCLSSQRTHMRFSMKEAVDIKGCEMTGLQCFKFRQQWLHVWTIVIFKALNQNHAEPTWEAWQLLYVSYPYLMSNNATVMQQISNKLLGTTCSRGEVSGAARWCNGTWKYPCRKDNEHAANSIQKIAFRSNNERRCPWSLKKKMIFKKKTTVKIHGSSCCPLGLRSPEPAPLKSVHSTYLTTYGFLHMTMVEV